MSNIKTLLAAAITFALPLNATKDEVLEVIASIKKQYDITDEGVAPTALVATNASLPAATASAPAATVAPTGDVDAEGLPWDERIHSSSKAKNGDGTWRIKKGADKGHVTRIKNELRTTMAASANTAAAAPAPVAPAAVAAPAAPATPAMPPIPGMPATPAVDPTFSNFVNFLASHTQSPANPSGRLTTDWIKAALTNYGVANGDIQNLAHNTALIPNIEAGIKQALGIA